MSSAAHTSIDASGPFARELSKWARLWSTDALVERLNLRFSKHLRRTWGRTLTSTGRVTLNAHLLKGPRPFLIEVLCHEVAHVAVELLHGKKVRHHGKEWKALMKLAGYVPRTALPAPEGFVLPKPHKRKRRNLLYRCTVCQKRYWVRRYSRHYFCTNCKVNGFRSNLCLVKRKSR